MKLYPNITIIFIIWLAVVLIIFYFGFLSLPHSGKFSDDFFKSLSNWDGGHFLGIAEFGYQEKFQYAFFPLYPLLIRGVNYMINNYLVTSLTISILSAFFAIHILYNLISLDFSKKFAENAVLTLLIFPTSFYFLTAYSESLFLLLTVSTFYFARKNKLFLATISASLSSATRLVGLATVLGFLVEVWLIWGINKKNWYVFLSLTGFIIYSLFLYNQTGDPFYFITAEKHWLRSLSVPGFGFLETFRSLAIPGFLEKNFSAFMDLIFAIFGLGLMIRSFRFLPPAYSFYGLASIILPLFTPSLSSMPRFLLPIFPIFILIVFVKREYIGFAYQLISIMLLSIFTALFINGYWVS